MKTNNKRKLSASTRRGLFAWTTLIISIVTAIIFAYLFENIFYYSLEIDSINVIANNSFLGMTPKMQEDLELFTELQNENLLMFVKFLPLFIVTFFTIYIWYGSSKSFRKSLLFK